MYKIHNACRACGYGVKPMPSGIKASSSERLKPVLNLGVQPLANDFRSENEDHAGFAPLEVLFCPKCSLAQLSVVIDPKILYRDYPYVTSTSDMMRRHFEHLHTLIQKEQDPRSVIEVGSNDGVFLKFFQSKGTVSVLGIDTAKNLVEIANDAGVPSICAQFENDGAGDSVADVIVARHVLGHIDNWKGFIKICHKSSHKNTLVVIEIPYAGQLIQHGEVDTIYHEHLSYMTYRALDALLQQSGFHIHKIHQMEIHGGSIAIMLRRDDSGIAPDSKALELVESEHITEQHWLDLAKAWELKVQQLGDMVRSFVADGKKVVGFGASAKSTVWVNCCKFMRKELSFICDNTPQKQWKVSPGSDIPIVDEWALIREQPDFAVMFCWNFRDEVIAKQQQFLKAGGKFIVPVPTLEIVP